MNRPYQLFLKCFYFFLLFYVGCSSPKHEHFFEKFALKEARINTEVFRAQDFPTSIAYEDIKSSLLLAGNREGLSCFVEYYELNSHQEDELDLILEDNWSKHSSGTFFHEKKMFNNNRRSVEIRFIRKEHPFVLFGSFLFSDSESHNLIELMPELYQK